MLRIFLSAWLLLSTVSVQASESKAELRLLSSIKPLTLIAREVVGDKVRLDTLLPPSASAHTYSLRVSDARRLQDADLVLWIGEELETFLKQPLARRKADARLSAYHLPGIFWPSSRAEAHAHHDHHDHHHHEGADPHLWLDPRNAAVIALALADRLAGLDLENADFYAARAQDFAGRMTRLDETLGRRLAAVQEKGFAVYHEGYLHFVERYRLRQLGFVTYIPEHRPGARHLYQLRRTLKDEAVCLFVEPYYDPRGARDLAAELKLTLGTLDPMGSEQVETYEQLLTALADNLSACLTQS